MMEALNFGGCLNLLAELVKCGAIAKDPNNEDNVLFIP